MTKFIIVVMMALNFSCASNKKGNGGSKDSAWEPSDAEINAEAAKAYEQVKAKSPRSKNAAWTEMVQRVSKRIAKASGENFQWEVILIEENQANAWCMPGGKMAVYTGILPILKTEAALAAVMGHEVAHATKRHGKKGYARAMKGQVLGAIVGGAAILGGELLCKTPECKTAARIGGAATGLAVAFFQRKFSREDETEADNAGQIYMAQAGYDPSEAIKVWERMAAGQKGTSPPEFTSTHPSNERRQNNLRAWLPNAEQVYQRAPEKFGLGESL